MDPLTNKGPEEDLLIVCFVLVFYIFHVAFGRAYLPALSRACKYNYLEKDDSVKSSQVTSNILSYIKIYWSTYCRKSGI